MNSACLSTTASIQPRLSERHAAPVNGGNASRRSALRLKSLLQPSFFSVAFVVETALASPAAASDVTAKAGESAPTVEEASDFSARNSGLSLQGYFGTVGGSFTVGGGISSPWFSRCMRVGAAFGVAFYPDALDSDPNAAWTPFGYGHARVEVGPPFLRSAPIRPYAFGGLAFSLVGEAMSNNAFALGGLGGIGLEAGFSLPDSSTGPVTYGLEFAGVGSGASVLTPARDENLLSGFSASAVMRGYLW